MTNNKPQKKTQVFRTGQVEEHEIGLIFEEVECPTCDGSGEEDIGWEGIPSYEDCSDCGGSGVFSVSMDESIMPEMTTQKNSNQGARARFKYVFIVSKL